MFFSSKYIITLSAGAGVLTVVFLYWRKTRWVQVGQVTELLLFPLKGGQALSVPELECGERGPRNEHILDRGFMIGTEDGEAIDYRVKYNKVVLIRLSPLQNGWWMLQAPDTEPCEFLAPWSDQGQDQEAGHQEVSLSLWDVEVTGLHCGPEAAAWLSRYLGGGCLLIQHTKDEKTERKARMKYLKTYPRTFPVTCIPGFADVTPYMMTTEPSLRDLRSRLPGNIAQEVTQKSFRPNIVIDGADLEAWAEDSWVGEVKIGRIEFKYNRDCTRCLATTLNPNTGQKYGDEEPLKTLKSFRQHDRKHQVIRRYVGDSPVFGMHYSVITKGSVKVGDSVWVRGRGRITDQHMESLWSRICHWVF